MARACPQCGAPLQRLSGADGHLVIRAFAIDERGQWMSGRIVQVPRLDAVLRVPALRVRGKWRRAMRVTLGHVARETLIYIIGAAVLTFIIGGYLGLWE